MSWDFSTDPEFQEQLDWMRDFVRARDLAARVDLARARTRRAARCDRAARRAGQGARAVGLAPAARARRSGHGPGAARADARDPRRVGDRAARVRQRGARFGQLGDPRARRNPRAEGALAAPAAGWRSAQRVQHDRARHPRLGPDAAAHQRRARRRAVGDRRPQVVLLERLDRRLPDRDGGDQSRGAPVAARVDVRGPRRHARRRDRARRPDDGASVGAVRLATAGTRKSSTTDVRVPAGGAARARGRGLRARAAAARAGAHPPLHALARGRAARFRHDVRAGHLPPRARFAAGRQADRSRTGSPTAPPRCRRRA